MTREIRYRGGSMRPLFAPLDVLVVEPVAPWAIGAGDVIVFPWPGRGDLVVHRVIAAREAELVTQGDALAAPDAQPVERATVTGRVVARRREGVSEPIAGGAEGLAWFRSVQRRGRRRRAARGWWCVVARPLAPLVMTPLMRRLRAQTIERECGRERRLCLGRRTVAVCRAGDGDWQVRAWLAPWLDAERAWRRQATS